ncbi:MAG: hypothetical protein AAGA67_07710 [Cyanobacteria bacterium P01_F01_bin.153]
MSITTVPAVGLPPDPTEGVATAPNVNLPTVEDVTGGIAPPPQSHPANWADGLDPELAGLAFDIQAIQYRIDHQKALMAKARQKMFELLEKTEGHKFECPLGVFQLAKNPGKVKLNEGVTPAQLADRFQKITINTKAISQALEMDYDVPAYIEPPEQVYRLVVNLQ